MARTDLPVKVTSGTIPLTKVMQHPLIVAHGGAGPQDPKGERFKTAVSLLNSAISSAADLRIATEIVLKVAQTLEADPEFNAGRGASIQADGVARVSASFMESESRKFSAVMNVEDLIHPSVLALHLQNSRFCILDHMGATDLKRELELPSAQLVTKDRLRRWIRHKRSRLESGPDAGKTGTIGCVAADISGQLAALTSTGGVGNETAGRVGDTPTIAGNYCTQMVAVSCTGIGEQIIAHALAPRISIYFETNRDLKNSLQRALEEAKIREFEFAAIAVAVDREKGVAHWAGGSVNAELCWTTSVPE